MSEVKDIKYTYNRLKEIVGQFVMGKEEELKLLFIALLSKGHVLIEGVPGIAKTLLAKTFASSLDLKFRRIQFTPDMLPSEIIGSFIFDIKSQSFVFSEGPIFTNVILADEINRAPPKTQSALLEAMQEYQVTVGGLTKKLDEIFFVIATQNPVELEGTYPLPEAQLDRFMFRIVTSYPKDDEELQVLKKYSSKVDFDIIPIVSKNDIIGFIRYIENNVYINDDVNRYILEIIKQSRYDNRLLLGASTRAALLLAKASKCLAAIKGRDYVTPDDIKELAFSVLNHRLIQSINYRKISNTDRVADMYLEIKELIFEYLKKVKPPR
ncbi:MAG: MoxR family ATPase [Thermoproteota archaeon]|jgi:MoxR-like ATPases